MENLESYKNNQEHSEASRKWKEKGYLGVTASDHEFIGSTPDEILLENPGKTLGEIMSDEEIRKYVSTTRNNISENEELSHVKEHNDELKRNLEVTLKYLEDIGRLPEDLV